MRGRHVLGILGAGAAVVVMTASPAFARGAAFSGEGSLLDDWWNEEIVSASHHAKGNVTALWQQILWSEGYLPAAEIDCEFGPKTTAASKKWQADHGLDADGLIGKNTWKKAATEHLTAVNATTVRYDGIENKYITFTRPEAGGNWTMSLGSDRQVLWYDETTFVKCAR
ncbi:peptidoglycan-binding protein [Streptomyces sp. NPDC058308]|uniref:peptidoglycan-binding domain-containing protein n=1 Tax=Streptomyces sp. NPDC058308 TaxID=3346440 RepID=UPI0036EE75AF